MMLMLVPLPLPLPLLGLPLGGPGGEAYLALGNARGGALGWIRVSRDLAAVSSTPSLAGKVLTGAPIITLLPFPVSFPSSQPTLPGIHPLTHTTNIHTMSPSPPSSTSSPSPVVVTGSQQSYQETDRGNQPQREEDTLTLRTFSRGCNCEETLHEICLFLNFHFPNITTKCQYLTGHTRLLLKVSFWLFLSGIQSIHCAMAIVRISQV